MTFLSISAKRLHYLSLSSRRARRAPTDENMCDLFISSHFKLPAHCFPQTPSLHTLLLLHKPPKLLLGARTKIPVRSPSQSPLFLSSIPPLSPARPRVVRTCKDAPSCSFRCGDPSAMVRHRRIFHRSELRPFVLITPESIALDEVIAGLTSLAVGQAGTSLHDPVTSMAVDEDFSGHNA
ncbi:uncharacterized protein ARMOST_01821 [Armillaria ostoyae]|uniref:Uncharacterized protein n=1 Tax=Armillaria ostoyae TaxID=47428 RepID=A0A284QQ46_ARMOS|nr:uncharacterized protein ARMOST_01821 [Armillaria ostoyae]